MADFLYGRVCRVEVYQGTSFSLLEGVVIEGHRIQFDINKDIKPENNTAEITITNAPSLDEVLKKGASIKVFAGYELSGGARPLFVGEVTFYKKVVEVADIHTVIYCKEGVSALREDISISYGEGTSVKTILKDLVKKLSDYETLVFEAENISESSVARAIDRVEDGTAKSGFAYVGEPSQLLDTLCDMLELQWSFQNGLIHIVPKEASTLQEVVVLSSGSGLVGSIEPTNISGNKKKRNKSVGYTADGYKIKALLFPEILPGDPVAVEDSVISGVFKVEEISHYGDTHGDRWGTTLTVSEVGTESL